MDYYIGEIRIFPYSRIPSGWQAYNGQILNIQQNAALYSLVGTYYGGNGTTTFALPDLRSRVAVGLSTTNPTYNIIGTKGGAETVQLNTAQMPIHTHLVNASSQASTANLAAGNTLASTPSVSTIANENINVYAPSATQPQVTLADSTIGLAGVNAPHANIMPYNTLQVCICVTGGSYPSRN